MTEYGHDLLMACVGLCQIVTEELAQPMRCLGNACLVAPVPEPVSECCRAGKWLAMGVDQKRQPRFRYQIQFAL